MVCGKDPMVKGEKYIVESEPSLERKTDHAGTVRVWGPAYRNADFPGPEDGWTSSATTLYELFLEAVTKFGDNKCLAFRPGKYEEANPY